ncbi:MAG: HEPN domain-containing protein, partial [Bdellovibrionaceae bacterium]|nr:HEPN domain-containing protein [Pseudobdellovibrionaceae bacterium]
MTKTIKKQLFPKPYAQELFRIAQGYLASAAGLMKAKMGRPENVVFLAHQAVEKVVKAVLIHLQIPFPLVHDLGVLIALLPDQFLPPGGFSLTELNPFASIRRYEEGPIPLTEEELKLTLETASGVMD